MLREYICMTHPLNIPCMVDNGHFEGQGWSPDPPCLIAPSPQSGLRFGWRNIKPMLVYLPSFMFQFCLKLKCKKHLETEGNGVFFGHRELKKGEESFVIPCIVMNSM